MRVLIPTCVLLALVVGEALWQKRAWERELERRSLQRLLARIDVAHIKALCDALRDLMPTFEQAARNIGELARALNPPAREE